MSADDRPGESTGPAAPSPAEALPAADAASPDPTLPVARTLRAVILPVWAIGLFLGTFILAEYSLRPGAEAAAPAQWPQESLLERAASGPTVVMAVHPRCPCTRASIEELARLAARVGSRARIAALFFDPGNRGSDWIESGLWSSARAIPGVECIRDTGGAEIRRFGVETSGQVLVYDAAGALVFRGGITGARGHAGDNAGRSAVEAWILEGRSTASSTPVFGCEFGLCGGTPGATVGERATPP
jgi:hypothetical protein